MFTKLAIWYLRKKKVSTLINYSFTGGTIQQLTNTARVFDCQFKDDFEYLLPNEERLEVFEKRIKFKE